MNKPRQIETLMLIDDDEFDHILCKRVVEKSGLVKNFVGFYYAEEALSYLKKPNNPKIDIIALDINMPRMDGFEFLSAASTQLGERFSDTVVMMLTTSISPEDKQQTLQYECVKGYFNKPLIKDHLSGMLECLNDLVEESAAS